MSNFLPYGRQWINDDDIEQVVNVLRGNYLTTGPSVETFEKCLTDYTGAGFAAAVNSGTSALHVAYFAAGLGAGDEIITSPMTFAATGNAALYLGASVKFVDVQPDTGNIDSSLIEQAITKKTKLIVPVDFTGHPADYDDIQAIANKYGIKVVADAAHSLGAVYKGRKVGTLADATELSFHPVKPVTTAEGGAVLSSHPGIAKRASIFRTHGITRNADDMQRVEGPWWYEMHHLGFNYRLTDLQCALGISQMKKLDAFIARRRQIVALYDQGLKDVDTLLRPGRRDYVESGWHLYIVRISGDPKLRKPFFDRLRQLGLGVQVHYIPVHYLPYYQELGFKRGQFPIAEDFYARAVSLPIYPKMTDDDVYSAIERIKQAANEVL